MINIIFLLIGMRNLIYCRNKKIKLSKKIIYSFSYFIFYNFLFWGMMIYMITMMKIGEIMGDELKKKFILGVSIGEYFGYISLIFILILGIYGLMRCWENTNELYKSD